MSFPIYKQTGFKNGKAVFIKQPVDYECFSGSELKKEYAEMFKDMKIIDDYIEVPKPCESEEIKCLDYLDSEPESYLSIIKKWIR